MKPASAQNPSTPRKPSRFRRIFSSQARFTHSSLTASHSQRGPLELQRTSLRNEQWIYL